MFSTPALIASVLLAASALLFWLAAARHRAARHALAAAQADAAHLLSRTKADTDASLRSAQHDADNLRKEAVRETESLRREAIREADALRKEAALEVRERAHAATAEADSRARAAQAELSKLEQALTEKTRALADRLAQCDTLEQDLRLREKRLAVHEAGIATALTRAEGLVSERQRELQRVAGLAAEEARDMLL